MKVAHVNTNDIEGGAGSAVHRLHAGLLSLGVDSHIVVARKASNDPRIKIVVADESRRNNARETFLKLVVQEEYINRRRTDVSNTIFSFGYPGYDISTVKAITDADVINLHWVPWFQSPFTLSKLFSLKKPVVWTLHDQWPFTGGCHFSAGCQKFQNDCSACPMLEESGLNLPAAILRDKLEHYSLGNLSLIAPSRWMASLSQRSAAFRNVRVDVIPNSVNTDVFAPLPRTSAKRALGIPADTVTLLFVAENPNEKRKGFLQLCESLSYCTADEKFHELVNNNRITLMVVGGKPDAFENLGVPSLLLGYLKTEEQLREAFSAADIFLLPSLDDNLPNSLLEAMSCGAPPIAFDVGGVPDVINNGANGIIVEATNSRSMSDSILSLISNPRQREFLGIESRRTILERFSPKVQVERYIQLYSELISRTEVSPLRSGSSHKNAATQSEVADTRFTESDTTVCLDTSLGANLATEVERVAVAALLGDQLTRRGKDQANLSSGEDIQDHDLIELLGSQYGELREKEGKITQLKSSLDERLLEIGRLKASLDERLLEIERLKASLDERARGLLEKQEEITATQNVAEERGRALVEKEQEIASTKKTAEERSSALIEKEQEIAATKKIADERAAAMIEKEEQIAATQKTAEERGRELLEKEREISATKKAAEERSKALLEKEAEISSLRTVAQEREKSLNEKEREIAATQQAAEERSKALLEKEAEIAALQSVAQEREKSLNEKEQVISAIHEVAEERARLLQEKENIIQSIHQLAEDRFMRIHALTQELEEMKKDWGFRFAAGIKSLLKRIRGK